MIVMFPLFVPPGVETDKLMRVLVAFTLFNAANFAEVFRGGLAAVPPGQIEAGRSLGLSKWHVTGLILVPQAIAITVPGSRQPVRRRDQGNNNRPDRRPD